MSKPAKAKHEAPKKEHWKQEPDEHDYPAAADYLSLVMDSSQIQVVVGEMQQATTIHKKAKDLLRASRLELLVQDNLHVAADLDKVRQGECLSPVLLVRGEVDVDLPLTVADGYHRICASYHLDEDADIPCRMAERRR